MTVNKQNIQQIKLSIAQEKNITLIFPPVFNQQTIINYLTKKSKTRIIDLDCRLIGDLSSESFFSLLFYLVSGRQVNKKTTVSLMLSKITQVLNQAKKPKILIIKNLQYLSPIIDSLILSLEVIKESLSQPLVFVFTTTNNLYSERSFERTKTLPFILDNVFFFGFDKPIIDRRQTEIIWYSLSEIQRRLIRLIIIGDFVFEAPFLPDIDYLLQTGLVAKKGDSYINNLKKLPKFLSTGKKLSLSLKQNKLFYGEELIQHRLKAKQLRVLRLLVCHKNQVVSRDKIAEALWKEKADDSFSEWAIDKFIQRLRKKLEDNLIDGATIKAVKGKGFIYQPEKKPFPYRPITIKNNGLVFEELNYNRETVEFHQNAFHNKNLRKILYKTTPETKQEVIDWLKEIIKKPEYCYFTVRKNTKLVGHIGLDQINNQTKSARVGCFLVNPKLWPNKGLTIFKFIIEQAKKHGLRFLYVDIAGSEKRQINILKELDFKTTLNQKNLLFYKL